MNVYLCWKLLTIWVNYGLQSYSKRLLVLKIVDDMGKLWFAILFYGHPKQARRNETWVMLQDVMSQLTAPFFLLLL